MGRLGKVVGKHLEIVKRDKVNLPLPGLKNDCFGEMQTMHSDTAGVI